MMMKLTNKKEVNQYISLYGKRIEKALIYMMEYVVADLQNHAKLNGAYQDQTSNLRSSIGGVVLKDGKPVTFAGFEGTPEGVTTGKDFIGTLISEMGRGYTIIVVAGMEYGTYVENYHGLNVLKKTELKMRAEMPGMLEKLKQKIDENYQ